MGHCWAMDGSCAAYAWIMHGIVWIVHGIVLICVDHAWIMYRLCIDYVYIPRIRHGFSRVCSMCMD